MSSSFSVVIPAKAGIHSSARAGDRPPATAAPWIPAFAGMTSEADRATPAP
jgi:hypothetical protein